MDLGGFDASSLTTSSLLGIAILAILLGWLVPKHIYKEKCKESENWKEAYETEREARVTSDAQTAELLELTKTDHNLLVALLEARPRPRRQSGGSHVASSTTG